MQILCRPGPAAAGSNVANACEQPSSTIPGPDIVTPPERDPAAIVIASGVVVKPKPVFIGPNKTVPHNLSTIVNPSNEESSAKAASVKTIVMSFSGDQ